MKTISFLRPSVLAGLLAALVAVASAQENVPAAPAAAVPEGTVSFKSRDFEHRKEFSTDVRNLVIKLDAQLAELSKSPTAQAPDRAKVIDEAKSVRLVLENQLGKVDQATAENWETTRAGVLDALARLQAALAAAAK